MFRASELESWSSEWMRTRRRKMARIYNLMEEVSRGNMKTSSCVLQKTPEALCKTITSPRVLACKDKKFDQEPTFQIRRFTYGFPGFH